MSNIMDYMDWRGDIPFSVSPFNEIDNLIFAKACFFNWYNLVPESFGVKPIMMKDAMKEFMELHDIGQIQMGVLVPGNIPNLVKKMAQSPRFANVKIWGNVNHISVEKEEQFSATTFIIPGGKLCYVAFRGTDDTLIGWKENINLSYLEAVPAQREALMYLETVAKKLPHYRIIVGGHSKGGNLAVYASSNATLKTQKRIQAIYNNDGPGFQDDFFEKEGFKKIALKVINIFPEGSVVGLLFDHKGTEKIVPSVAKGLMQHDGFSWQLHGTSFDTISSFSKDALKNRKIIREWIEKISLEEREAFSNALFEFLTIDASSTLTDVMNNRGKLLGSFGKLNVESRHTLWRILALYLDEQRKSLFEPLFVKKGNKK